MHRPPNAFRAIKKLIPVSVTFATQDGELATLEGQVKYQSGDALLTGVEGEQWPVQHDKFLASYTPVLPLTAGSDGSYVKKPLPVWVWRAEIATDVVLSENRGKLRAAVGDFVIEYATDNHAVVSASIFEKTYEAM
jgi:hypothetical protein